LFFISSFIVVLLINFELKRFNVQASIKTSPVDFSPEDYPTLKNAYQPIISAQGAIVIDRDSQVVLFKKNPYLRFSPASTTKIMSALVAFEYFNKDDLLVVKDYYSEGAILKLNKNEKFKFEDLLYAMMLPSANDAAKTIAANYPGGEKSFVLRMNEKAKELGLKNTNFADPVGIMDTMDYTTPLELARLASFAMQNSEFRNIVSTKKRIISNTDGKVYELENLNVLLDVPGVNGIKTGFTEEAGQVLVTSKIIPGTNKEIIFVVMQSEDRFGDTQILLNYLDNNLSYQTIHQ
jgi:D-alanyl-D-alanine carboxypeptidase